MDSLKKIVEEMREEAAAMREVSEEFVAKVERGEARSKHSYSAFKNALSSDAGRDYADRLHAIESEAAAMREHIERYGVISSDDEIAEMQKSRARVLSGEAGKGLVEQLRQLRAELDREHQHKKHLRGALDTCTAELER